MSSTTSCTTSTSSSTSGDSSSCSDPCIIEGECHERRKELKDNICPKSVKTFNLDTCLISYKPRLITVPSCRYPNIDCALASLRERKGGYVIRLKPGTHNVTQSICSTVDRLHILGDCNPFAGQAYINGCGLRDLNLLEFCENTCSPCDPSNILGRGPFLINFSGRRITVNGSANPDFSQLCKGQLVGVVHRDGTITTSQVVCGNGNSITFTGDLGVAGTTTSTGAESGFIGEGFFFLPNVILTGGANWQPSEKLTVQGVHLQGGLWVMGTHGLYFEFRNSTISRDAVLFSVGIYRHVFPNTIMGEIIVDAPSMGLAYFQTFAGETAKLVINGSCSNAWRASIFTSARGATRVINGARADFAHSSWVNNCLALGVINGSEASVHDCEFCGNKFAIFAIYHSVVTSFPIRNLSSFEQPPILRGNQFAVTANYTSYVLIAQATLIRNVHAAILDQRLHQSPESLSVGRHGVENSLILFTVNSFALGEPDTRCVQGATTPHASGRYLNFKALHGLADYSLVRAGVTFQDNPQAEPTATETAAALGTTSNSTRISTFEPGTTGINNPVFGVTTGNTSIGNFTTGVSGTGALAANSTNAIFM